MTPTLLNLFVFTPLLLLTLSLLVFLFLPYPVRLRFLAWKKGIKIPYFKTAASLHEYLESSTYLFGTTVFCCQESSDTFCISTADMKSSHFRLSRSLKAKILSFEPYVEDSLWKNYYWVDQLLPLAAHREAQSPDWQISIILLMQRFFSSSRLFFYIINGFFMSLVMDFAIMGFGLAIMQCSTLWSRKVLKNVYKTALSKGSKSDALNTGRAYYEKKNRGWFGLNFFNQTSLRDEQALTNDLSTMF